MLAKIISVARAKKGTARKVNMVAAVVVCSVLIAGALLIVAYNIKDIAKELKARHRQKLSQ